MWIGNTRSTVRTAKLKSDVQKLNEVVTVYLANGGSLSGITDPQDVLNHLKIRPHPRPRRRRMSAS